MENSVTEPPEGPCKQCEDVRRASAATVNLMDRDVQAKIRVNRQLEKLLKEEQEKNKRCLGSITVLSDQCDYLFQLLTNTYGVDASTLTNSMPHNGEDQSNGGR